MNRSYAIVDYYWLTVPPGSPIVWHTGDPETDPWEWRVRVLNERNDVAYANSYTIITAHKIEESRI